MKTIVKTCVITFTIVILSLVITTVKNSVHTEYKTTYTYQIVKVDSIVVKDSKEFTFERMDTVSIDTITTKLN